MSIGENELREPEVPVNALFANCDAWGVSEWFERLVMAIQAQDRAVIAKDDVRFEIYRNIASSSAMRLARDYADEIRTALDRRKYGLGTVSVKQALIAGADEAGIELTYGEIDALTNAVVKSCLAAASIPASRGVETPKFEGLPQRKLEDLLSRGWEISGYSIWKDDEHGLVTSGGFVGWFTVAQRNADAAEAALASSPAPQPVQEQEPVAWRYKWGPEGDWLVTLERPNSDDPRSPVFGKMSAVEPLYASPPALTAKVEQIEHVQKLHELAERLRAACNGHPHAQIDWPHRILHEAADAIEAAEAKVERLMTLIEDNGSAWLIEHARAALEAADAGMKT